MSLLFYPSPSSSALQLNGWWRGVCVTGGWRMMWACGCVQWQVCVFYRWTQKTHLEIHSSSKMQPHGMLCLVFTLTSKPINVFVLKIIQRAWSLAPFAIFKVFQDSHGFKLTLEKPWLTTFYFGCFLCLELLLTFFWYRQLAPPLAGSGCLSAALFSEGLVCTCMWLHVKMQTQQLHDHHCSCTRLRTFCAFGEEKAISTISEQKNSYTWKLLHSFQFNRIVQFNIIWRFRFLYACLPQLRSDATQPDREFLFKTLHCYWDCSHDLCLKLKTLSLR